MTNYHAGSYRIRVGWHEASALTEQYAVRRFPRQSDQKHTRWLPPLDDSSIYDRWQETVVGLSGVAQGQGQPSFSWHLGGLTPGMVAYIQQTLFDSRAAQQFTVMTWDRGKGWRVVQCYGHLQPASEGAQPGYRRGYKRLRIDFLVHAEVTT